MNNNEIEQYISDIIYCSSLSIYAQSIIWDKELLNNICEAIKYIQKNK